MKPQAFIFIGRYGSGKGTQSELLIKALAEKDRAHKALYVQTGQEFRQFFKESSYSATLSKSIVENGGLMPVFMCVYMWMRRIDQEFTGGEHLIFDGTPRKLEEAKILGPVFSFYGLDKPWVIYLDVEHEESHRRLVLRARSSGRVDDGQQQIANRKIAYETEIVPTIDYYRTDPTVRFLDIPGERTIEEIHADIVKRIGL
jgi:adenylate kinase